MIVRFLIHTFKLKICPPGMFLLWLYREPIHLQCFMHVCMKGNPFIHTSRFHLGFLSRGANVTFAELRGGGGARTIVILEVLFICKEYYRAHGVSLKLGGLGACSPQKKFNFQSLRLFLVVSETNFSGLGRGLLPVHCCFCEYIC